MTSGLESLFPVQHLMNSKHQQYIVGNAAGVIITMSNARTASRGLRLRRLLARAVLAIFVLSAALPLATHLRAAERQRIEVQNYVIDATVTPQTHRLSAKAL